MSSEDRLPVDGNDSEVAEVPEYVRRMMIRVQGGKLYLPAAARIMWFREDGDCADWGIQTTLIEGGQEAGFCTVQASVLNSEGRIIAQGLKTETRQDFPAGWVEKAETGAIGRALAVAGWGTQFALKDLEEGNLSDSPQGQGGGYNYYDGDRGPSRPRTAVPAAQAGMDKGTTNQAVQRGHLAEDGRSPGPNAPQSNVASGYVNNGGGIGLWTGPGQCPRCHAPEGKRHGKPCVA